MPVKQPKANREAASQIFVNIAEIKDNCVVLKDGGLRAILKVSSVNFDLISEQEQNMIIYSYENFLNSLEFPIQILIRSKKLDIEKYLIQMSELAKHQHNVLLQQQTYSYIDFVSQLVELADIMEKEFYVVVPKDPFRAEKINFFKKFMSSLNPADNLLEYRTRLREFESLKKGLNQRVTMIQNNLSRTGVHVARMNTKELITLYYEVYNPGTAEAQKVTDVSALNLESTPLSEDTNEE
jgi:hypothetical protein